MYSNKEQFYCKEENHEYSPDVKDGSCRFCCGYKQNNKEQFYCKEENHEYSPHVKDGSCRFCYGYKQNK